MRCIRLENTGISRLPTSCIPEGVSEVLTKVALILHWFSLKSSWFLSFFFSWIFFHEHSRISGLLGKGRRFFKGYLRYKTTTQNVLSEAQVRNFFISQKSYVPLSRYLSFCIFSHPIIYQICDVMMSISTWNEVHFWIYLLNHNSLSHQTWPIDRYKQGQ